MIMIILYTAYNRFLWKPNGLSDLGVISMSKNKYDAAVYFQHSLLNSLKSFAEALVYLESPLWKCVLFSLTFFGTWKYGCVIKSKLIFYP